MTTVIVIGVALVIVIALVVLFARGGPRQEPGVVSFRKHIDALSPEARREVMDRVRPPNDNDNDRSDG